MGRVHGNSLQPCSTCSATLLHNPCRCGSSRRARAQETQEMLKAPQPLPQGKPSHSAEPFWTLAHSFPAALTSAQCRSMTYIEATRCIRSRTYDDRDMLQCVAGRRATPQFYASCRVFTCYSYRAGYRCGQTVGRSGPAVAQAIARAALGAGPGGVGHWVGLLPRGTWDPPASDCRNHGIIKSFMLFVIFPKVPGRVAAGPNPRGSRPQRGARGGGVLALPGGPAGSARPPAPQSLRGAPRSLRAVASAPPWGTHAERRLASRPPRGASQGRPPPPPPPPPRPSCCAPRTPRAGPRCSARRSS